MLTSANFRLPRFLGLPNIFTLPVVSADLDGGAPYSPSYGVSNVLTIDPARKWRSLDLDWINTNFQVTWGGKEEGRPTVDALGLVNYNLWDGTGYVRFVLHSKNTPDLLDPGLGLDELDAVDSANGDNVDGDHTDLGSAGIGPLDPGDPWLINLEMAAASGILRGSEDNLETGASFHWVKVLCGVDDETEPTLASEAPTLSIADISPTVLDQVVVFDKVKPVTAPASDPQWLIFRFDADNLTATAHLALIVSLLAQPSPDGAKGVRVLDAQVVCESDQITGNNGVIHDTRWIPAGASYAYLSANTVNNRYPNPGLVPRRDLYWPLSEEYGDIGICYVAFRDDHVRGLDYTDFSSLLATVNPPQYIECGHIVGGLEFVPENGVVTVPISRTDHGSKGLTDGLATFGQRLGTRRGATLSLRALSKVESNFVDERILEYGYLRPYLISINPGPLTDANIDRRIGTMFVTNKNAENTIAHREVSNGDFPRSINLVVEEYK